MTMASAQLMINLHVIINEKCTNERLYNAVMVQSQAQLNLAWGHCLLCTYDMGLGLG